MSGTLHVKLAEVMGAVGYIPKTGRNQAQGYPYAEASAIADKVRDELAKRRLTFVPTAVELIETGETFGDKKQLRLTLRYTWSITDADSGESITVQSVGSGTDPLDKAPYKAATGALKYALLTTFQIPTGDDPEADDQPARAHRRSPIIADAEPRPLRSIPVALPSEKPPPPEAPPLEEPPPPIQGDVWAGVWAGVPDEIRGPSGDSPFYGWKAGERHDLTHNPLKYEPPPKNWFHCPTRVGDGWCQWRAKEHPKEMP